MKKIALVSLFAGLFLAACSPEPVDVNNNPSNMNLQKSLPAGCSITYLGYLDRGSWNSPMPIVAVICEGKRTSTVSSLFKSGKHTYPAAVTSIEDM